MKSQFSGRRFALLLAVPFMNGHAEDGKDDFKALMKRKLEASQKVLEGLTLQYTRRVGLALCQNRKNPRWRAFL